MNVTKIQRRNLPTTTLRLAVSTCLTVMVLCGSVSGTESSPTAARQAEVATRGAKIMPFDLERTRHLFQSLDDGGLQTVTAKDPGNREQIALIQAHLQEEAAKFQRGDFSDPATIHGEEMPGLAELKAGAGQISIQYLPWPDGAQIRYTTKDSALVMASHHWFMAQRADHGRHATGHYHPRPPHPTGPSRPLLPSRHGGNVLGDSRLHHFAPGHGYSSEPGRDETRPALSPLGGEDRNSFGRDDHFKCNRGAGVERWKRVW